MLFFSKIYNIALLINADCRTKDALEFIVKELNPAKLESPELEKLFDDNDTWLKELFDGISHLIFFRLDTFSNRILYNIFLI